MDENEIIEYMKKGDTGNPFKYFNFDQKLTCYDFYEDFARQLVGYLQPECNPYNYKKVKEFNFKYCWNINVNASSIENEYDDSITLNEGAVIKIYSFFYKLINSVSLFQLDVEIPPYILIEINSSFHKKAHSPFYEKFVLSDNSILNNLAEYLSMFSIKYLIAHEVGHAFGGHSIYYNHIPRMIKESTGSQLYQCYLDLQTMETDADTFASTRIMEEAFLFYKSDKNKLHLANKVDILKMPIYAIHCLHYIFRDYRTWKDFNKEHPPAFVRESMSLGAAKATLDNHSILFSDEFYIGDIAKLDDCICTAYKTSNDRFQEYVKTFGKEAGKWAQMLSENYKNRVSYKIKSESRLPVEGLDY
ncbi:hypothetical protein ABFV83_13225 [Lacrimispora sp. BS-2]|uniref:Peptidase M48 domain-containing protein n=1 Tax=Lacrimispora sp. BS-2 TaxID=3151850 RepID=A0AAU7PKU3_9FIRM